jgi:thymidylate synthase (FAD)
MYIAAVENSFDTYEELIKDELRKELARGVLPMSTYTQFYWTVNARALMNFLELRLDIAAQYEIRQYAKALHGFFQEKMPYTAQAFEDLILGKLETPRTKKDL